MQLNNLIGPELILEYLILDKNKIEARLLSGKSGLITTDFALYQALGSVNDRDKFNWRKLVKLLENVKVVSHENVYGQKKSILTHKKVLQLRKLMEGEKHVRKTN